MNPEFIRNLWLDATPRRIVGVAVVLGIVYAVTGLFGRDDPQHMASLFGFIGVLVFFICGAVWAARAAGGAVLDEIRGRTWDFQRLSALSPWEMTWGKLLGAAALAWIAALTGLAAAGTATLLEQGVAAALTMVCGLIALGLFLQGCAMAAALIGVRKARAEGRPATSRSVLLGVIGGAILLGLLASHLPLPGQSWTGGGLDILTKQAVVFWGSPVSGPLFTTLSMAAFAAWAVTGAWRLMRLELQMRNSPWIWLAFLIFVGAWRAGLAAPEGGAPGRALTAAAVFAALAYAAAFVEPADPIRLRRFAAALGRGGLDEALDLAPAVLFPLKLAVLCFIIALVVARPVLGDTPPTETVIAAMAFMIRDLGVIAICRFGRQPGRGDMAAVVALVVLYGVGGIVDQVIAGQGGVLFSPLSTVSPLITLISGVVQAAIACVTAAQRIGAAGAPATAIPAR